MKTNIFPFSFNKYSESIISPLINKRKGETKLGEKICYDFNDSKCKYVILGISEDIGPQTNSGLPGSKNAFKSFLNRFLNNQSNRFLIGSNICILGEVSQEIDFIDVPDGKSKIEILDQFIFNILNPIILAGKIPIIIGGGHNNAYPIIKSVFTLNNKPIDVVNLDPHADCRPIEGRHSGNPFSYAKKDGYINQYTVFGLHQQYNSESIYEYLDQNKFHYTFFEDYLDKTKDLNLDLSELIKRTSETPLGVEIDLDCIAMMPTSAFTPSGFSIENVRTYLRELAKQKNILYLHLPEGSPTSIFDDKILGKTLSYLVVDFIKENNKTKKIA